MRIQIRITDSFRSQVVFTCRTDHNEVIGIFYKAAHWCVRDIWSSSLCARLNILFRYPGQIRYLHLSKNQLEYLSQDLVSSLIGSGSSHSLERILLHNCNFIIEHQDEESYAYMSDVELVRSLMRRIFGNGRRRKFAMLLEENARRQICHEIWVIVHLDFLGVDPRSK